MPADSSTAASTQRTAADIEAELSSLPLRNEPDDLDDSGSGGDTTTKAPLIDTADPSVALAIRRGWVPKSEYTGDPAKWVDAKTFVERGEKFNHNLQREVAMLRKKLDDFEGTRQAFVKFHEETIKKKEAELSAAITQLRIQRSEAIGNGEHQTAVELEDRIEVLQDERKAVKAIPADNPDATPASTRQPGPNPNDPVLLEWIEDGNQWFNDDAQLRAYAITVGEDLIAKGETVRGRKFLDKVAGILAEEFPRKFKARTASGDVPNPMDGSDSTGTRSGGRGATGGKTERDLPDVDLQLMRQFIKEGWTTKEKFLKSYFGT